LSHSTSPFFVKGFFQDMSLELFKIHCFALSM
jgi:hypothetical protein